MQHLLSRKFSTVWVVYSGRLSVLLSVSCSMAIIYGVFSASNLIAPSVVTVIGPQLSMFFSGLLYR